MYDLGEGVETDYVEAMKWYLKAAELGSIDAMRNIGFCMSMDKVLLQMKIKPTSGVKRQKIKK